MKYKDKILHFIGGAVGVLVLHWFVIMDLAVFGTLLFIIGVEVGDFKNYGWSIIKSKDKVKIKEYIVNTVADLIFGVFGILIMALLIGVL